MTGKARHEIAHPQAASPDRDRDTARPLDPDRALDRALDPDPDRAPARPVVADADVLPFPSRRRRPLWPYFGIAAVAAVLAILALGRPPPIPDGPGSLEVAAQLRREATKQCNEAQWRECVDTLNQARDLDVAGDGRPEVQDLRAAAGKWLTPAPVPPAPSAVPPVEDKKGGKAP